MEKIMEKSKLAALIGAGIAASVSGAVIAGNENPFQAEVVHSGYNIAYNEGGNDSKPAGDEAKGGGHY